MLEIITPSALTTIQDAGRHGWMAYGVPASGPMDAFAHRAANLLVANPPGAAAIEIGYTSAGLLTRTDCLVAAAGPGYALTINGHPMRMWTSIYVRKNSLIRLEKVDIGNWVYLATHGGIQTAPILSSQSSYLPARLGPGSLVSGDILPVAATSAYLPGIASRTLAHPLAYCASPSMGVIPGPQKTHFPPETLHTFYSSTYMLTPTSDRVGYRLSGPALKISAGAELISEGMARGCIQVPPDGQPIVMQADCPTTGGYSKIAAIITAHQPLLAQAPMGAAQIGFFETDIETAQAHYRAMMTHLAENITDDLTAHDSFL